MDEAEVQSTQNNTDDYRIDPTVVTNLTCLEFTFHVLVHNEDLIKNESQLKFSLHTNDQCRNYDQLTFDIIVLSCPLGFDFFPEIRKCNCANKLQGITIDCKITIGRLSNKFWIS